MDDKHIEDMLRDSWSPEPPEGMRERVLGRAREELLRRRRIFGMSGWKLAFATLGLLVVLVSNLADHARQERLAAMMNGATHPEVTVATEAGDDSSLFALRDELDGRVALSRTHDRLLKTLMRGG